MSSLPLVFLSLKSHHSVIVQQLGVANILINTAKIDQSAGRLSLFKDNWKRVCSDQWANGHNRGISHRVAGQTMSGHQPTYSHFSKEETESLKREVEQTVVKGGITPVETDLSSIFLIPKKHGVTGHFINLKRLNDFVLLAPSLQDGGNSHAKRPLETGRGGNSYAKRPLETR